MVTIMSDDLASTTRPARLRIRTAGSFNHASPRSAGKRKVPRKISAESLENAALFYLALFSTPGAHLRWVLLRRVDRSLRVHGGDRAEAQRLVDDLIARFHRSGLLDDAAYASNKARG